MIDDYDYNININYPWSTYPVSTLGNTLTEYTYYDIYKTETIKLMKFINDMNANKIPDITIDKLTLYLCIGNPMDELYYHSNKQNNDKVLNEYQYKQLFPQYLENMKNILIIIISPDIHLKNEKPRFIDKMKHYDWFTLDDNTYISPKYSVLVKVFVCPFISIDDKNKKIIENMTNIISNKNNDPHLSEQLQLSIGNMIQTTEDLLFIDTFYNNIETMFRNITKTGIVICNYFAVFAESGIHRKYNDYYFCSRLITLFKGPKMLLSKWIWSDINSNTFTVIEHPLKSLFINFLKLDYANNKLLVLIDNDDELTINYVITINNKMIKDKIIKDEIINDMINGDINIKSDSLQLSKLKDLINIKKIIIKNDTLLCQEINTYIKATQILSRLDLNK